MLKIERGEVCPLAHELVAIAEAMKVPVDVLLIDFIKAGFDREQWAREHIEAKLTHRGGSIEAMHLGAAVRVKRQQLGKATTDMKDYGLPAATVSRIENADRPFERWDATIQRGIAKVLGLRTSRRVMEVVTRMYENGELDATLNALFSPAAIEERNGRRLRILLADLPGPVAAEMLDRLGGPVADKEKAAREAVATITVMGGTLAPRGGFLLVPTNRNVELPASAGPASFAVEMIEPVLGPGLPKGAVIIADPHQAVMAGDVIVVMNDKGDEARVLSTAHEGKTLIGFSMMSDAVVDLDKLPEGTVVGKMVSAIL